MEYLVVGCGVAKKKAKALVGGMEQAGKLAGSQAVPNQSVGAAFRGARSGKPAAAAEQQQGYLQSGTGCLAPPKSAVMGLQPRHTQQSLDGMGKIIQKDGKPKRNGRRALGAHALGAQGDGGPRVVPYVDEQGSGDRAMNQQQPGARSPEPTRRTVHWQPQQPPTGPSASETSLPATGRPGSPSTKPQPPPKVPPAQTPKEKVLAFYCRHCATDTQTGWRHWKHQVGAGWDGCCANKACRQKDPQPIGQSQSTKEEEPVHVTQNRSPQQIYMDVVGVLVGKRKRRSWGRQQPIS